MNTTPFGVSNFWEFNLTSNNRDGAPPLVSDIFGDAHSGIIIEGNKSIKSNFSSSDLFKIKNICQKNQQISTHLKETWRP